MLRSCWLNLFIEAYFDRLWYNLSEQPFDKGQIYSHLWENWSMHDSEINSDFTIPSTVSQYLISKIKLSDNRPVFIILLSFHKLPRILRNNPKRSHIKNRILPPSGGESLASKPASMDFELRVAIGVHLVSSNNFFKRSTLRSFWIVWLS